MNTHSQHNEMPQLDHGSQAIERLTEDAMLPIKSARAPPQRAKAKRIESLARPDFPSYTKSLRRIL